MKTLMKVLNAVAWMCALVAAVLGNPVGAVVLGTLDDDEDDTEETK